MVKLEKLIKSGGLKMQAMRGLVAGKRAVTSGAQKAMGAVAQGATQASQLAAQKGMAMPAGAARNAAMGASRGASWVAGNPGKTLATAGAVGAGYAAGKANAPAQQKQAEQEKIGGEIGNDFTWPPKV